MLISSAGRLCAREIAHSSHRPCETRCMSASSRNALTVSYTHENTQAEVQLRLSKLVRPESEHRKRHIEREESKQGCTDRPDVCRKMLGKLGRGVDEIFRYLQVGRPKWEKHK